MPEAQVAERTLYGWRNPATRDGSLPDCSLVIATYRRSAETCALLRVLSELHDVPEEVIVVDGSPDEETRDAVASWARSSELSFDLIYIASPAGLTRQRNVGIEASSGSVVFFLDDDCLPRPGYFRTIRDQYAADANGEVGAICGSPINEMGIALSRRWRLRMALGIAPRGELGGYAKMGASMPIAMGSPFHGARRVSVMPGCTMSFRRTVLERHSFSSFFHGYSQGEDLEMSLRVGRECVVLWCGDAHAIHNHAPGGRPASLAKGRMEVRNRYFIWKRHAADAGVGDRVRFWADTLYSAANDVAYFVMRPWSLAPLRHMLGAARGVIDCLSDPPSYAEPAVRREYAFELVPLADFVAGGGTEKGGRDIATAAGSRPTSLYGES
jgi:glycosyltransferase involved in cell wall biosynthesis